MGRSFSSIGGIFGSSGSVSINGLNISVNGDQVYVNGVLYVPADAKTAAKHRPKTPGKIITHDFQITEKFKAINAKGFIDVTVRQSNNPEEWGVTGRLPKNYIDKFEVEVSQNTLIISTVPGFVFSDFPSGCSIDVVTGDIETIQSGGSGDLTVKGDIVTGATVFQLYNSGSGDMKCCNINASKRAVSLNMSGSGDCFLGDIETMVLTIRKSGSGDISVGKVTVEGLEASISGSGSITISGTTKIAEFSITGSGDIVASDLKAESGKASIIGSGDIRCNVKNLSERVRGSGDIHNSGSRW